jgi:ATP-dependent DNA ligase
MLAKSSPTIPPGMLYEPKWDGFRCIVFRDGDELELASRSTKPLTRYFPEVVENLRAALPQRCVVDGEIVVPRGDRLDFEALLQRVHPAESRVRRLAEETPAEFVAFDVLSEADEDLLALPSSERRARLTALLRTGPGVHLTPQTADHAVAQRWFEQFEGAGLDGVVAKHPDGSYEPDKRTMIKVKHQRTADCVVAGLRPHKTGDDAVGSLLLGLYGDDGHLIHVGVVGALPMAQRRELMVELAPLVVPVEGHVWAPETSPRDPSVSSASRWSSGKDLSFVPLDPVRVVEVAYDHTEGPRFRHTAQFVRWRDDRDPRSCTFDQLEEVVSYDLAEVLGA